MVVTLYLRIVSQVLRIDCQLEFKLYIILLLFTCILMQAYAASIFKDF